MKFLISALVLIIWISLYFVVKKTGLSVLNKSQKYYSKRWGDSEKLHYNEQKADFIFYLNIFFIGIPILVISVALITK